MSEGKEIIEIPSYEIGVMREPKAVLAEAKIAAQALMTVVAQKAKPVVMNGEQYLEFEDWQTVAKFYGVTAKVVKTEFIDLGGVKGFEATAEAIRLSDGMAISSADSMCLNDEDKWSTRSKFEYVNGKRTKVGDVAVPLFQLRSMAQTRACAKALRNVLAWVVVLAGFKPTVAEEMTGDEESNTTHTTAGKPAVKMPEEKKPIKAVDLITLLHAKVKDEMSVVAFFQSVKVSTKPDKNDKNKTWTISEYTVSDLPTEPTAQAVIKAFGDAVEVAQGKAVVFANVKVGEYNGSLQYVAKEVSVSE